MFRFDRRTVRGSRLAVLLAGLALVLWAGLGATSLASNGQGNDGTQGAQKQQGDNHGDCPHDNSGNHNGFVCGESGGGGGGGGGSDTPPGGGDCKNDNAGNHNGYDCGDETGGGGGGNPGGNPGGGVTPTGGGAPSSGTPLIVSSAPAATTTAPSSNAPSSAVLGARACASRRSFTIHVRHYKRYRYRSVRVTFRGKVLANRKGTRRVSAPIVLKGLPRGTFTIRIRVVTTTGKVLRGKRVYHTCVPRRPPHRAPRL